MNRLDRVPDRARDRTGMGDIVDLNVQRRIVWSHLQFSLVLARQRHYTVSDGQRHLCPRLPFDGYYRPGGWI